MRHVSRAGGGEMNRRYFPEGRLVVAFYPSFWLSLKLWLFGRRYEEHAGLVTIVVYQYRGVSYMTKCDAL